MATATDKLRVRHALIDLGSALEWLRKCQDTNRIIPVISQIRKVRNELEVVLEDILPRRPGEEGTRRAT